MLRGIESSLLCAVALVLAIAPVARDAVAEPVHREAPFVLRLFSPATGAPWIGNAIAYGPHRDGQSPDGAAPTLEEIREDLFLLQPHWKLLRVYGSTGATPLVLQAIRESGLDLQVMLGVWIAPEERLDATGEAVEHDPTARAANEEQVSAAIRIASEYPEIVAAISVGNETQVTWSAHRSPLTRLIECVRAVRAQTVVPVTVADDFAFWLDPVSRTLTAELDFVVMHAHPLWNGLQLEDALAWTRETVARVRAVHPDRLVVLGETGWATRRHVEGEQARLIKGATGESEQAGFHAAVRDWSEAERVVVFFFEAFDENWKGSDHPDEVEKHWGLLRADRSPKIAFTTMTQRVAAPQEQTP